MDYMISAYVRDSFPDDWPDWVLHCLQQLSDLEESAEERFLKNADEWVFELTADSVKTLIPTTKFDGKQSGAEFLGSLIGHQEHLFSSMEAEQAMEDNLVKLESAGQKLGEALQKLPPELKDEIEKKAELYATPFNDLIDCIENVIDSKTDAMLDCIRLASEQEQQDKIEFFRGYSKALSISLYDENGQVAHQKILTDVSTVMVMFWRQIDEMENLPEVFEWAKKIFPNKAMNWEQFRKMCNRKGLSKASPGRPKK